MSRGSKMLDRRRTFNWLLLYCSLSYVLYIYSKSSADYYINNVLFEELLQVKQTSK